MIRAFQWDLGRQVERLSWLKAQLPRYAEWGYNELYLHLEDAVEFPSLRGVARADAYTQRELGSLVEAAGRFGIGVVPIVNLLGHTQYLIKVPGLRDLNELRAEDGSPLATGQICPSHPRTTEVAYRLIHDIAPFCSAGCVHVGLDESFNLGRHPLSRADVRQHGLAGHFAGYVNRLHAIADHFALHLSYWADMLYFLPDAIPLLPPGSSAYDWYYYSFPRHPRVELLNFAERDLAAPLAAQGIGYWGCPMNSGFRHEPMPVFGDRLANIRSWWRRCEKVRAEGMLVTSWETSRIAAELTTVVDAAAASLWLDGGKLSDQAMLAKGFARAFPKLGRTGAVRAARTALAADAHAYSGYARWEMNERWDGAAGKLIVDETRKLEKLRNIALAPPLESSLEFRLYLAKRDAFVGKAANGVFALRRLRPDKFKKLLKSLEADAAAFEREFPAARRAVDAMWGRTRSNAAANPNRKLLELDRGRLDAVTKWLKRVGKDPRLVLKRGPLAGAWQLLFTVENFRPAQQKVVVEERGRDGARGMGHGAIGLGHGAWRMVHGRYTIEFRDFAARPRAKIRRETSVPVDGPEAKLRIGIQGAGSVRILDARVTDGITIRRIPGPR